MTPTPPTRRSTGCACTPFRARAAPGAASPWARARATGVPQAVARGVSPELAAAAETLADGADRVIADDPMAAVALLPLARRRPVIYSAGNLESDFRPGRDPDWGSRRSLRGVRAAPAGGRRRELAASRADLDGARELAPDAALRYVPNVVDVAAIEPSPRRPTRRERCWWPTSATRPTARDSSFLLEDVMPLVWARPAAPAAERRRARLDPPPASTSAWRCSASSRTSTPLYAQAACALVPLLSGGGSPVKFIEALAHGLPVVATPRAAAGIDAESGRDYLEGAGADGFAAALLAALEPERGAAVGAAGRALAESEHSIEALARRLAA